MDADGPVHRCDAAYQGAPGAYSEAAARAILGAGARLLPLPRLPEVFAAVVEGRARQAVVPVENTLTGSVPNAYELLVRHALEVRAETVVHVDHVLAGPAGASLDTARRALSHPVALAQCAGFFETHPAIVPVPVFDTAGAVPLALQDPSGATIALASRRAAALHGATVVATDVQDHAENWTRFLLVARPDAARAPEPGAARKSLLALRLPHEPGALVRLLQPLAARGLNVTRLDSRPIHGRPFEYLFLVELIAPAQADVDAALGDLRTRGVETHCLGTFAPCAPGSRGGRSSRIAAHLEIF
jgi:prephenate dehydratase